MSATVDIQTKKAENILSVPIQSVTTRSDSSAAAGKTKPKGGDNDGPPEVVVKDDKDKSGTKAPVKPVECVFVLNDNKVKLVKVKTGIQDNDYIEIREGLKEGDEVVSGPYSAISTSLKDGVKVRKVEKTELFNNGRK